METSGFTIEGGAQGAILVCWYVCVTTGLDLIDWGVSVLEMFGIESSKIELEPGLF